MHNISRSLIGGLFHVSQKKKTLSFGTNRIRFSSAPITLTQTQKETYFCAQFLLFTICHLLKNQSLWPNSAKNRIIFHFIHIHISKQTFQCNIASERSYYPNPSAAKPERHTLVFSSLLIRERYPLNAFALHRDYVGKSVSTKGTASGIHVLEFVCMG